MKMKHMIIIALSMAAVVSVALALMEHFSL